MKEWLCLVLLMGLSACDSTDKAFLGYWKRQGDRFGCLDLLAFVVLHHFFCDGLQRDVQGQQEMTYCRLSGKKPISIHLAGKAGSDRREYVILQGG